MARIPVRQIIGIPLNILCFVLLMIMAWHDQRPGFFDHPTRVLAVALLVISAPVMTFCTAGRSQGVRHARDDRAFFPLLVFHSLFTAYVMPFMDARNVWVLPGGDVLRWVGVLFLAAGVVWRLGPMMALGRRFASVVAVQEGHRLYTRGFYSLVRHPSYLGIFLMDIGFAGVFRSALAVALLPMVFWMFKRRMDIEEGFLLEQFGGEYRDYMARVPRVLPGIY